jgi:hypothetical protein
MGGASKMSWILVDHATWTAMQAAISSIDKTAAANHTLLQTIATTLKAIKAEENQIMVDQAAIDAKLAQAATDAAAEKTVVDSFVSMFGDILAQLAALKNTAGISQATADAIDALDQGLRDRAAQMTAAMVVNTPAPVAGAPPTTPAAATAAATAALAANPLPAA